MDGVFEDYRNVSIQVCRLFAGLESSAVLVINLIIIVILYMGGTDRSRGYGDR